MRLPFLPKDDREAGRKFLARLTNTPAATDAASMLAAKIIDECRPRKPLLTEESLRSAVARIKCTFTPTGGESIHFTAKSFSIDPGVEEIPVSSDAELAEAAREMCDRIEADLVRMLTGCDASMSTSSDSPGLTSESINELIRSMPKVCIGIVVPRADFIAAKALATEAHRRTHGASPYSLFQIAVAVFSKADQVERCKAFYSSKELVEYLETGYDEDRSACLSKGKPIYDSFGNVLYPFWP
jgi:hypothetical protein